MRTRFAPSPTGPLHLGHAYSSILAYDMAKVAGHEFLVRIEDIDQSRVKPEWEQQIFDDLLWLGLSWPEPVMRQSHRQTAYRSALDQLWSQQLLYPCTCTRKNIHAAAAPNEGEPLVGPDGIIYPGTCRAKPRTGPMTDAVLRLDMGKACKTLGPCPVAFMETGSGPDGQSGFISVTAEYLVEHVGDIILARRDMGTSYHLAVVVDDAAQQIGLVTRGADLFDATAIHIVLQRLLGLPTPTYHHHSLIRDAAGKRLAKRDDAKSIALFRQQGATPKDIREMVGLSRG